MSSTVRTPSPSLDERPEPNERQDLAGNADQVVAVEAQFWTRGRQAFQAVAMDWADAMAIWDEMESRQQSGGQPH
jgi:hypothetical protein